jgi:exodeoxyribonuclease VII large subunit
MVGDEAPEEPASNEPVLSVAELTAQIKGLLEGTFPRIWVSGEISNCSRPQSGHYYLTLKDDRAQIRAVVWRTTAARMPFDLNDGMEVICRGSLGLYAPRGTYQLVIDEVQPKGIGALELALRKLRDKLAAQGLFDPRRKRPLPRFPRKIAVVTSPTGAAIRDFLEVLKRRWRGVDVLIVPVRVQGAGAALEIAGAIALVNDLQQPIDCLVVTRGGGSLEDLWAFNEEPVVWAIHGSRIPVISAIGHEIDVTLADLVADVRALTPSEAAELVAPAREEIAASLRQTQQRLLQALVNRATSARRHLDLLASRRVFARPLERIHDLSRRVDELERRIHRGFEHRVARSRSRLDALAAKLEALSPLQVLGRGYSLTQRLADSGLINDAAELQVGEEIITRFVAGQAVSRVEEIRAEESASETQSM